MAGNFQHPFQCIHVAERQQSLLIASAGPRIYSYTVGTGKRLDVWPRSVGPESTSAEPSSESSAPPEKKRKVSPSENEALKTPKPSGERVENQVLVTWSTIPLLAVSSNAEYVVALTGEDKTIRVLKVEENSTLCQLSARRMSKRPSAIVLTGDDSTILSADKFGDVYSLPLIPGDNPILNRRNPRQAKLSAPAASNLTVHTKRNLDSLKQQMLYLNGSDKQVKSGPDFEHRLLLGHVSLLTDLVIASVQPESSSGTRSYILTADRDEHIRVSRAPPQAHVIENYCLGHTSFISKLCVPRWSPELLISGGGDNHLLVWKWTDGCVLQKVPLVDQPMESAELAVRGIWAVSLADFTDHSRALKVVLVAIEGSAQLRCYVLEPAGRLRPQGHIQASGNVLSVTNVEKEGIVLVSVDCVREAGSTHAWRANPTSSQSLLEAFRVKSGAQGLQWEPAAEEMTASMNSEGTSDLPAGLQAKQQKEMNESLYGLGNLRKKATGEDD